MSGKARSYRRRRSTLPPLQFETLERRVLLAINIASGLDYLDFSDSALIYNLAPGTSSVSATKVLRTHTGAEAFDAFRLVSTEVDNLSISHARYQQVYNGFDVDGGIYTVHSAGGEIIALSGKYIDIHSGVALKPTISNSLAGTLAVNYTNQQPVTAHGNGPVAANGNSGPVARRYVQEDPALAKLLGLDGPLAGQLMYHANAENEINLTWRFDIYTIAPEVERTYVYVNANSGEIEGAADRIHDADIAATGTSLYDGTVNFTADVQLITPSFVFRLRQAVDGVETYDLNNTTNYGGATDFNNNSANFTDPSLHTGVQAHWGTEQTMQYFLQTHGRDSFDDAGTTLRSYVSYGTNYVNAFWNGSFMTYGDGNGTTWAPLVSLDVVGHEIGHGVTQFSANLVYSYESGALNESFSDIFGEMVERYGRGSNDWKIGGDFDLVDGDGFRSMSNPKLKLDPDTYMGQYWHTSSSDNGGVHTNSGVQNKWFYILSVGESGVNDHGFTYNVTGIGSDDAARIAYRNLTTYLTSSSSYQDARDGAVQSAIDLFGVGSAQHIATDKAWEAVGLYGPQTRVEFQAVAPEGSLIYTASYSGAVVAPGQPETFVMALDPNQRLTIVVEGVPGGLLPEVTVYDSFAVPIATSGPTSGNTTVIQSVYAPLGGDYIVEISGFGGTSGGYDVQFFLNANVEEETFGGSDNGSLATAVTLEPSSIALGDLSTTGADRLAAVGFLDQGAATGGEDFETGFLSGAWTTYRSHPGGLVYVTNAYGASSGQYALIMEQGAFGAFNLNEAIYTVDLTNVANPVLSFDHVSFGDENHKLPLGFVGHYNGDGVSISDDGVTWYTVLTNTRPPSGQWQSVSVDLSQIAFDLGLTLGANFKIKFQQYDDFGVALSDGRGYDNISIGAGGSTDDWYAFELASGTAATIAATHFDAAAPNVSIELYNSSQVLVATGTPGTSIHGWISQYVAPATGTWYVRVTGTGDYSLVVTRNAEFDFEPGFNQPIDLVEGALGHVRGTETSGAEPDNFGDGAILNTAFPGVILSNGGSGSVYAANATFGAPTGTNVFAPAPGDASGWNEADGDVFRATFTSLQRFVSIDVGSDDASDVGYLRAFDSLGNLLVEVVSGSVANGGRETLVILRPGDDIAYIEASGVGTDVTPLDNLVFKRTLIDEDTYTLNVQAGQFIEITGYLPSDGSGEFHNLLAETGTNYLRLELVSPFGTVVATGSNSLQYLAAVPGTYQLIVSADFEEGEYFVAYGLPSLIEWKFDFGPPIGPVEPGFTFVSFQPYNPTLGYGWTDLGPDTRTWITRTGTDLRRDGIRSILGTFAANVNNGLYEVELYFGNMTGNGDIARYELEGNSFVLNPARNSSFVTVVSVGDGRFDLTLDGFGGRAAYAFLSGLRITPVFPFGGEGEEGGGGGGESFGDGPPAFFASGSTLIEGVSEQNRKDPVSSGTLRDGGFHGARFRNSPHLSQSTPALARFNPLNVDRAVVALQSLDRTGDHHPLDPTLMVRLDDHLAAAMERLLAN